MNPMMRGGIAPQQKLIHVNDQFGTPGLRKQQGSTIEVYDSILLDSARLEYSFFRNSQTKVFPFTNVETGTLEPQESFVLERAFFTLVSVLQATGVVTEVRQLDLTTDTGISMGEIEFFIVNQRLIRPLSVRSFFPEFNQWADHTEENVKIWDTQLIIPPLLKFRVNIRFPEGFFTNVALTDTYLFMTLGGPGGIFAPKANY